ncbi:MAG: hypothetical protein GTO02_19710, partial [Candidatus Dadabacteria bacterium]|nr:hypothetical protein [Candidatus Dadabacteria bacterium]
MINKAVAYDETAENVDFILTKYPSCSSVLEPDLEALSTYSFYDYFIPIDKCKVPAVTLNKVIEDLRINQIHWLKLDTQGTDLKILKSLSNNVLNKLIAVDIEPGFINSYINEDLFVDCHNWLIKQGFWLSQLNCQKYPKVRFETLE